MPFEIVRNDIANMQVDAIVNTANPRPVIGSGVDACLHQKAGPGLLEARQRIGRIAAGKAAVTPGFDLHAKYVIHTVGPVWHGGLFGEARLLRSCYDASLALALEKGCRSVAFPLISSGNYGFPKDKALQIAMEAISGFLLAHEMQIYLVVYDRDAFRLSEKLFRGVSSFIDETYIQERTLPPYGSENDCPSRTVLREELCRREEDGAFSDPAPCAPMAARPEPAPRKAGRAGASRSFSGAKPSLAELLDETDAGFSETLLKLIDRTGKKDSEIYARANITRQHFSKIRNNPDYRPTKATAVAFAIALELDLEQTRDLIGRAGYALTRSSKFDVIIMYFIRERNYNLFDINAALFEFDQSLLGGG